MPISNVLISEWAEAKRVLNEATQRERKIRAELTKEILGNTLEGTVTFKGQDCKLVATAVLNRSIDEGTLSAIWDQLTWEEQQCVEYRPKLKVAKYKEYEALDTKLLEAVTVKPGMAQLKMEIL